MKCSECGGSLPDGCSYDSLLENRVPPVITSKLQLSALALYISGRPTVHTAMQSVNGLRETHGSAILPLSTTLSMSDKLCRERGKLGNEPPMPEKGQ